MTLNEKHILHVEAVNKSKTAEEHASKDLFLTAWRIGARDAMDSGERISMIDADNFYLYQGIDRPMCCGVWLDWEPTK